MIFEAIIANYICAFILHAFSWILLELSVSIDATHLEINVVWNCNMQRFTKSETDQPSEYAVKNEKNTRRKYDTISYRNVWLRIESKLFCIYDAFIRIYFRSLRFFEFVFRFSATRMLSEKTNIGGLACSKQLYSFTYQQHHHRHHHRHVAVGQFIMNHV